MATLILSLAPLLLVAAGIITCTVIFISLKKEIHSIEHRMLQQQREFESWKRTFSGEVATLQAAVRDAEERTGVLVPPAPPKSGLNLNKRSQALKMSRLGGSAATIATALSLQRKEVELLLKVQKIVLSAADESTS